MRPEDKKRLEQLYKWKEENLGQLFYQADPAGIYAKYFDDRRAFLKDPVYSPDYSTFPAFDLNYPKERDEMISNIVWMFNLLEEFYEEHQSNNPSTEEKK